MSYIYTIEYSELKTLQKLCRKAGKKELLNKLKTVEDEIRPKNPALAVYVLYKGKQVNGEYADTRPTSNTVDIIDEYAEMYEVCCELDGDGCDCTSTPKYHIESDLNYTDWIINPEKKRNEIEKMNKEIKNEKE